MGGMPGPTGKAGKPGKPGLAGAPGTVVTRKGTVTKEVTAPKIVNKYVTKYRTVYKTAAKAAGPAQTEQLMPIKTWISHKYYQVRMNGWLSGKCLTVSHRQQGSRAVSSDCVNSVHQKFYWDGDQLRSKLNDMCLDIKDGAYTAGADLIMWPCGESLNQQWHWTHEHSIQSLMNNKCVDVRSSSLVNGESMLTWDCKNGLSQKFNFVPA